ncbi:2-hydroxymuconate tautomerase [Staphylococcus cohnii]|uniref:Tautomerase n=1 Tax=Staphylococcus cohnii TaxID=29382 RepID=A0A2T4LT70_9STAP|nr:MULTISPECIES: 2-hydroxymuconate tautomerase [Staphylococcus]HLQ83147.1 2-hydroxymuconate tautomerase [Pseudogracilibacillus sp.]MBA1354409.1 4-oxalocrotonate tautomerase [Staphylococcus cohnii]MBA1391335.1 4-oxalocrotonate tautomerase [Staphylococcus cohnii]MBB2507803.1 putative tautomerase.1 [Staphylococcus cohnii subsp. barensis]MBZ8173200.1 4-oxalocrotonate tautomerase [Staphylococcus cohnii]
MPIVNVKLLEGRSDEQLKNLVTEVTNAVEKTTGANKDAIQVVIEEMKASHYGVAGIRKSDQQ